LYINPGTIALIGIVQYTSDAIANIGKITLSANQIKVLEVGMANMKEH
jgi:hypothetical protein